ncbi:MAG: thioredoxin domain-containing protein [Candidatus Eisenbacteria bacterium]|uniref:Thioredoxin domain-containing protein n=1 Tax=Eiseniibacteriota bacterium TaxID=2212470 RepID=A0A948RT10_UNCEI|nr:thioredoxin domain-containing protein [Candidatus Eisenbacteria bacterium]MBU1951007.1 thioredoxin domain-containing protein [Candidatus Eisenbacteria bacterium]MBU2690036.1 thioredoxin domain-containing protein [Candidatus Eisenbacteria bacterium]
MSGKNHLAEATSPYLLQHAGNPVDWWPWGEEALAKARREDKPILVSIGYSACHWCHVMAHESFENPAIAQMMNDWFVCIKIDREERPDLDQIYMSALQMMTGSGGWPLNVFLTPDLKPFYGGTYFPPDARYGRPGWPDVLKAVTETYHLKRDQVENLAAQITTQLTLAGGRGGEGDPLLSPNLVERAVSSLKKSFDEIHGGFDNAPKFPHATDQRFLLGRFVKGKDVELMRILTTTLDHMAAGGIYDQIGGGFHRYSTDEQWLIPHFEKMLYDNALLARMYAEYYQFTRNEDYRRIAAEIFTFIRREMTSPEGGFYSTLDADSEGEEGKFYLWTPDEIINTLGWEDGHHFCDMFDITREGHLEGKAIPHPVKPVKEMAKALAISQQEFTEKLEGWKQKLLKARSRRARPGLDDKILTDWNGLMISAFARAGRIMDDESYLETAAHAANFVLTKMSGSGDLFHTYRAGRAGGGALLDDFAMFIAGLLDLWETTFDPFWLNAAIRLQAVQDRILWDEETAGYYQARPAEDLLVRMKSMQDSSTPSGNGVAAGNLLRLARLTGDERYQDRAIKLLKYSVAGLKASPRSSTQMLIALDMALSPPQEIVITGWPDADGTKALLNVLWEKYMPDAVLAGVPVDARGASDGMFKRLPLGEGRSLIDGKSAVYVCENYACRAPVTTENELRLVLKIIR